MDPIRRAAEEADQLHRIESALAISIADHIKNRYLSGWSLEVEVHRSEELLGYAVRAHFGSVEMTHIIREQDLLEVRDGARYGALIADASSNIATGLGMAKRNSRDGWYEATGEHASKFHQIADLEREKLEQYEEEQAKKSILDALVNRARREAS